jgi:hypothetical protein
MDHLPASLQALIQSAEALDLDSPLLATITDSHHHGAFSLLGQLLSPKPINSQSVKETLQHAWKFALPISFAVVGHHKYLFGISNQAHVQAILDQGPWNVRGSLLLLKPWSPDLALDEVNLSLCSFWVQVHGLPGQNMAAVNAVIIAQRLGKILAVDHHDTKGLICQPFLRFRVELDATQPLLPGFHLPRSGNEPLWISFRYERLGDYCTLCGLIGHKRNQCNQPTARHAPEKYKIPLQTFSLVGLRPASSASRDDSDSGLSSVGTSPSYSDGRSSPAQGADLGLQLVPLQHAPLPPSRVDTVFGSPGMQFTSQTALPPLALFPSVAGSFLHASYVSSPQHMHILSQNVGTQVGVNPFSSLSSSDTSTSSLAATSSLGSSRLSAADKGKSHLIFQPTTAPGYLDPISSFPPLNISHPCPISVSPSHTCPAHFADFLACWPYPFPPRPTFNPSQASSTPSFLSIIPPSSSANTSPLPSRPLFSSSPITAIPISTVSAAHGNIAAPGFSHSHFPFQLYPPYTAVTLSPVTLSSPPPPQLTSSIPFPVSPSPAFHHSPSFSRFHPYTRPAAEIRPPSFPLSPDAIRVRSPSPALQSKRKWTDDNIPLAVLKKTKSHHLFPGLLSNLEQAAISLTSLQDGDASVGSFLSIDSQSDALKDSLPSSSTQDPVPQPVHPENTAPVRTEPDPALASQRPLRRFTRAARGIDVYSQLQAAHSAVAHSAAGSSSYSVPAQETDNKGVDQDGLPPHK